MWPMGLLLHIHVKTPQRWRSRLERLPRKRKVGCLNPSRDRPKIMLGKSIVELAVVMELKNVGIEGWKV